jgi:dienelactone hydrolase
LILVTIKPIAVENAPLYFPHPTGTHTVGLRQYHWIDRDRNETHKHDCEHPFRELVALVWYPAKPHSRCTITLYHQSFLDFDKKNGYKITMLSQEAHRPIFAHYGHNLPLAICKEPFPLLIFSHGFGNVAELYTAYCAELASHGYVVISINHPYECAIATFPDGHTIQMPPELETMTDEIFDTYLNENIMTWILDTQFVVTKINQENQNPNSMFYNKIDLTRIGILGHSFGGATAIRCSQIDNRFMAACNLDGDLYGTIPCDPFIKPCLLVQGTSTKHQKTFHQKQQQFQKKFGKHCRPGDQQPHKFIHQSTYIIDIPNVPHSSFTDRPILRHAMHQSWFNPLEIEDGFALTRNINIIIRAFFDKHLKGIACDELEWCKL